MNPWDGCAYTVRNIYESMEHGTLICVVTLTPFNGGQPLVILHTVTIYTVLYIVLHIMVTAFEATYGVGIPPIGISNSTNKPTIIIM
jgi:hypothetical protein